MKNIPILLFLLLLSLPTNLLAQDYIPLDAGLGIYCVYLPDGSSTVARTQRKSSELVLSDFGEERARVESLIKNHA